MIDPCVDLEDELYFLRDENERLEEALARLTTECERLTKGLWDKGEFVDQLNGVIRRQRIEVERLRTALQKATAGDISPNDARSALGYKAIDDQQS